MEDLDETPMEEYEKELSELIGEPSTPSKLPAPVQVSAPSSTPSLVSPPVSSAPSTEEASVQLPSQGQSHPPISSPSPNSISAGSSSPASSPLPNLPNPQPTGSPSLSTPTPTAIRPTEDSLELEEMYELLEGLRINKASADPVETDASADDNTKTPERELAS